MLTTKKLVIAIDGYSSCGKSTLARDLAKELNYVYVDSGAMYRAVALYALRKQWIGQKFINKEDIIGHLDKINISFEFNAERGVSDTYLNGECIEKEIREMSVSKVVSKVSQIKEVRDKLVEHQQGYGKNGGVVMDGRDIGTVVFPNANLKLFVTASEEIRVERRYLELKNRGLDIIRDEIKENLAQRDFQDINREENPLKQAYDAVVVDNSDITPAEQLQLVLDMINKMD